MRLLDSLQRASRLAEIGARAAWLLRGIKHRGALTAADLVEGWARKTPNAVAIRFEGRSVTYAEYDAWGNRYADWVQQQGIRQGDVVAVLMENRPEYLFCWLGLAKVGAIGALINSNLSGDPLAHCLRVSAAKHLILGGELQEAWASARPLLADPPEVWLTRSAAANRATNLAFPASDLDTALAQASPTARAEPRSGLTTSDKLFYIYTSGTTGNPKAANISHYRFLGAAAAFAAMSRATARDRMYIVLPLYHSAGGMCAVGISLTVGCTIVLRRRFSATHFWSDCREERVTMFQYIGELCRYLVNSPSHPDERKHQIRLCVGNGLREDVWETFRDRFAIPNIVEFYGATEGNVGLVNLDGKVGAIGHLPRILDALSNVALVRFDDATESPVRGPDGFCIRCGEDEAGEAIGRIPEGDTVIGQFEGYTDKAASEKKILSNVFRPGDAWFRTGDLLRRDRRGYYYFVDRIGDTFRWKGENVSTNEVATVLCGHPAVKEANVYGVEVPGADGRAGMASLIVGPDFSLEELYEIVESELATYARPLFLRLQPEMQITGTFKHRKLDLVAEGFDPSRIADPLYFRDPRAKAFATLDSAMFEEIASGSVRF